MIGLISMGYKAVGLGQGVAAKDVAAAAVLAADFGLASIVRADLLFTIQRTVAKHSQIVVSRAASEGRMSSLAVDK